MKIKHKNQLTRQIGEHLVVSKLGRLGIFATPFAGNVPDFDVLASDLSGHSLPLQVKTINGGSWQFDAKTFLEIEQQGDCQVVKGEKKLRNPDLVCVFVLLKPDERDEFYIFPLRTLADCSFIVLSRLGKFTRKSIPPRTIRAVRHNRIDVARPL